MTGFVTCPMRQTQPITWKYSLKTPAKYYLNSSKIPLEKGDLVAVEASPGHDIGTVTLTGKLVLLQMKKNNVRTSERQRT